VKGTREDALRRVKWFGSGPFILIGERAMGKVMSEPSFPANLDFGDENQYLR
jgi:hypothetical protein